MLACVHVGVGVWRGKEGGVERGAGAAGELPSDVGTLCSQLLLRHLH